jgi:hypothetical protein
MSVITQGPQKRLRDIDWVAAFYGCSTHEIRRRKRLGLIPRPIRPGGRKLFWIESDLESDVELKKQGAAAA